MVIYYVYKCYINTHDKVLPARSFVTRKPESKPLVFGYVGHFTIPSYCLPDNHHKVNKLFILAFFAVFARKDKNTGSNSGRAFFALFFASKRILAVFLPPDLHHKILCEQSYFDPANRT